MPEESRNPELDQADHQLAAMLRNSANAVKEAHENKASSEEIAAFVRTFLNISADIMSDDDLLILYTGSAFIADKFGAIDQGLDLDLESVYPVGVDGEYVTVTRWNEVCDTYEFIYIPAENFQQVIIGRFSIDITGYDRFEKNTVAVVSQTDSSYHGLPKPPETEDEAEELGYQIRLKRNYIIELGKLIQDEQLRSEQPGVEFDSASLEKLRIQYMQHSREISRNPHITMAYTGVLFSRNEVFTIDVVDYPIRVVGLEGDVIVAESSSAADLDVDEIEIAIEDLRAIYVRAIDYESDIPSTVPTGWLESELTESTTDIGNTIAVDFDDALSRVTADYGVTYKDFTELRHENMRLDFYTGLIALAYSPDLDTDPDTDPVKLAIGDILGYIGFLREQMLSYVSSSNSDDFAETALLEAAQSVFSNLRDHYNSTTLGSQRPNGADLVKELEYVVKRLSNSGSEADLSGKVVSKAFYETRWHGLG